MLNSLDRILEKIENIQDPQMFFANKTEIIGELKKLQADYSGKNTLIEAVNENKIVENDDYVSEINQFKRLSKAMEHSPVSIVITDLFGNIVYVNLKFSQITGYSFDEAVGKNPRILKSEALDEEHYKELWNTIIAGQEWRGEFKNIKKNGDVFWELAYISSIKDDDGNISHFIALKEDITELKKTTKLQQILMSTALKYINLKLSDVETSINKSLHDLGQFIEGDRALIFDCDFEKQICTCSYEWCDKGIESRINELQNIPFHEIKEWIDVHKEGKILEIPDVTTFSGFSKTDLNANQVKSIISVPLMDQEKCVGFLTFDSIKKNHTYSEEVKSLLLVVCQLIVNLKRRNTLEKELHQETENAQKANIAKSEFLANMSHELRTPLNGVIGFSELLVNSSLSEVQNQYAKAINTSANILFSVINDILDFSKIESNKFELEFIKTDIVKILEQSVDIIKFSGDKKGLEILLDLPNDLPRFIKTDPVRLTQILANLLGNAVKFTIKGEIELKVDFIKTEGSKGIISFYVRDTGIGISKVQKSKLFKAFSQADSSTTRKFGGTGLGLIISDLIANKMGGKIDFISEENKGTTFFFSIETDVEYDAETLETEFDKFDSKCLIIDDNKNNQIILSKLLRKWNINSTCCDSGADAIQILEHQNSFAFIIVDYQMPTVDGLETIKLIRHKFPEFAKDIKFILMLSSLADNSLFETINLMGLKYKLTKPLKSNELFSCIDQVITGGKNKKEEVTNAFEIVTLSDKRKSKILIAEDDYFNLELVKALINRIVPGVELIEALNGKLAVEAAEREKPDLIFMDFQMPEMDGFEAIKAIRANEKNTNLHLPIIGLSASVLDSEIENGYSSGMDSFLTKPIDTVKLKDVLSKYF